MHSAPRTQGVGAAILAVCINAQPTMAEICAALAPMGLAKRKVQTAVSNLVSREKLNIHRHDGARATYSAVPGVTVRVNGRGVQPVTAPAVSVDAPAVAALESDDPANAGAPLPTGALAAGSETALLEPPSMGLRCLPPNRSHGRIEDALVFLLDRKQARSLDDVFAGMPAGWSRVDIVSALADGVIAGWVASAPERGRNFYVLKGTPPAQDVDPLAARYADIRLRERLVAIERDVHEVIADVRDLDIASSALPRLSDARSAVRAALSRLPE